MSYIFNISKFLQTIFITILLGLGIYYFINIGNRYVQADKRFIINKRNILTTLMIIIVLITIYAVLKSDGTIKELLLMIFYSIILAYLLNPIVNFLERRKIKRGLGTLIVYLVLVLILVLLTFSIVPKISSEFEKLIKLLPQYFNKIYDFSDHLYDKYYKHIENLPSEFKAFNDVISENLEKIQGMVLMSFKGIMGSIIKSFSKVLNFIIIPILTFYFLKDKDLFKKKACLAIPKKYRREVIRVSREIDMILSKFIRGQLIVATFVGIATTIMLLILGIDFAIIIGIIAGVFDIIPYVGPIIGVIPAIIFALLKSPIRALWVLIMFIVIQQLESNVLSPKIVGESVGLHPVVVLLSLLIGGSYFGILGMLLAVPVTAILRIFMNVIVDKMSKAQKY
ncbi:putative permease [Gottschalkia purinilytica]|uniref:Putative permease n=1 Tax=Gottschalkia purinilytica TaxID=1503 RepID=A0A0L0WEM2_GOTPU|nr:AI-2E family transporter [Gottschalkia purinilytica]KNF09886.1 putative permease [Gottschalkia purinilytica]